jgi:signal transduction histidine kinase
LERARRRLIRARQNETVNKERNRIARELHDNVAQHLISIGMHLEWCRAQLPPQTPVYERICSTKEMARGAITRVREAIFELSTIKTSQVSLIEALHDLASDFTRRTHLQVQIRVADAPGTLPAELEYACYHIVQEALFNAYKHAQAGNAWIAVRFDAELVQITVTDDGIGIPEAYLRREQSPPGDRPVGHFGLCSMHERAQEIGGDLTIMRRPSGGTEVCITAPLQMINRSKQCEHAYSVNDC